MILVLINVFSESNSPSESKTPSSLIHLVDLQTREESITVPHRRDSLGDRSTLFQQGPGEDWSEGLGSGKATPVCSCSGVGNALV